MNSVLIVDDSDIDLEVIKAQVEKAGYKTILISDPVNTLNIAISTQPDVILLDISMRKMTGFDVCRQLKSNTSTLSIPVIFISSNKERDNIEQAMRLGGVDFIPKPINPSKLKESIYIHDIMSKINNQIADMKNKLKDLKAGT